MKTLFGERPPDHLPDFRNFGVLLRAMVAINLAALLWATGDAASFAQFWRRFVGEAALIEPALLGTLGVVALGREGLAKLPYRGGALAVIALALALTLGLRALLAPLFAGEGVGYMQTALYTVVAAQVMLSFFRLRARALSPLLAEARLQALQARIRPHFLFNSLNAVLSLIRGDPAKAERTIEDLADLFRVFMADNRELAPLSREVELVRQYLEIEALRLGERLQVEWHAERMPGEALIPPLTLQPLLENAVYHGIEPATTPGVIAINVFRAGTEVHIDIRNPYVRDGGRHHGGNKMAMANIRERLALHFDAEASVKTTVGADYYQVHLVIPYVVSNAAQA